MILRSVIFLQFVHISFGFTQYDPKHSSPSSLLSSPRQGQQQQPSLLHSSHQHSSSLLLLLAAVSAHNSRPQTSDDRSDEENIVIPPNMKIIDSHLHIWANSQETHQYPYDPDQPPPPQPLRDIASTDALLQQMDRAGVHGALIVQPINYKFDHRYVSHAIKMHPDRFKGMMLFDPSFSSSCLDHHHDDDDDAVAEHAALQRLEELVLDGFVGVRFNPYLFSGKMSENKAAVAVFQRCGELKIPVGIMCFKGIDLHHEDILQLCTKSPETCVILDHFGFASVDNQKQFDLVLDLAKLDSVSVKISALFRLGDQYPYERVWRERFQPLLETFGAERLMFGSDFPYVMQEEGGYKGAVDIVNSWLSNSGNDGGGGGDGGSSNILISEEERIAIMGGNAERLFGVWGGSEGL